MSGARSATAGGGDGGTDHDKDEVPAFEHIGDNRLVLPQHPAHLLHRKVRLAVRRVGTVPEDVGRADRRHRLRFAMGVGVCVGEWESAS